MSDVKTFDTGAVRSRDAEAVRYDLITPIGLEAVAKAYAEGSHKYGDFNCEKGFPAHDLINHAIRHLYLFLSGDRSEPHLGHAAWNVLMAEHSVQMWPHLNEGHLRSEGCKPPEVKNVAVGTPKELYTEALKRSLMKELELKEALRKMCYTEAGRTVHCHPGKIGGGCVTGTVSPDVAQHSLLHETARYSTEV